MKIPNLLIGIIAVVVVAAMMLMGTYNSLVTQSQQIESQWAQVETQYQRRFDLIPNLVAATQGYLKQEQIVFDNIAKARQGYAGAKTADDKAVAAGELESALGRLLVIVENYPQLKSNETVLSLMDELAGTENRISVERKRYNELVQTYNTNIKTFPNVIVANFMGFREKKYFEVTTPEAENAPKVELNVENTK